jgi:spore coat polysaccharide biosynthesis predicted glycosyltransferase SpsG
MLLQGGDRLIIDPESLPQIVTQSDLVISVGGQTGLEVMHLGVPLALVETPHLGDEVGWWASEGLARMLGPPESAGAAIAGLIGDGASAQMAAQRAWELIDGRGAERMLELANDLLA